MMKTLLALCFLAVVAPLLAEPSVETIVCIRHGEKPKGGLGQLDCKGLNRALALPKVLLGKYGAPQFIFAPSTSVKVDSGKKYNYLRPLVTIEPTAIRCGLPVNTKYDFTDVKGLAEELEGPAYTNATVFVAWEHGLLDVFAKGMVQHFGGDPGQVPGWSGKDFDTIFLMKITRDGGKESIAFSIDHENLNGVSDNCPDD